VELYSGVPLTAANGGGSVGLGVTLVGGAAITVTLAYTASSHTLKMTMGSFSHSWTVDIPTVVDASTYNNSAYIGFAGYCSGWTTDNQTVTQQINNWTFSAS
jgi:hypothetical protein